MGLIMPNNSGYTQTFSPSAGGPFPQRPAAPAAPTSSPQVTPGVATGTVSRTPGASGAWEQRPDGQWQEFVPGQYTGPMMQSGAKAAAPQPFAAYSPGAARPIQPQSQGQPYRRSPAPAPQGQPQPSFASRMTDQFGKPTTPQQYYPQLANLLGQFQSGFASAPGGTFTGQGTPPANFQRPPKFNVPQMWDSARPASGPAPAARPAFGGMMAPGSYGDPTARGARWDAKPPSPPGGFAY